MKIKKNQMFLFGSLIILSTLVIGVTLAVFTDKSTVLGATFSAGSVDIKFLSDPANETDTSLYVDSLSGPSFLGLGTTWQQDYLIKMVNNGSSRIGVTSHSDYATANDPQDLRSDILVEIIRWNDADRDGQLDSGEENESIGKKSITKWKTEGFNIGEYNSGDLIPLILRFSSPTLSDSQQGASGVFDFIFSSVQI